MKKDKIPLFLTIKNHNTDIFRINIMVSLWWAEVDSNHRSRRRQIYSLIHLAALESARIAVQRHCCGAGDWTRTHNLLITNQLLCQLSYTGMWCLKVESNRRQRDFQSLALPTELSRHKPVSPALIDRKTIKKWRPKRGSNS